jgi:hypothetical protein
LASPRRMAPPPIVRMRVASARSAAHTASASRSSLRSERFAETVQDRLRGLGADVAREHHLFQPLQDGRVELFLALKKRGELRDEAAAGRGTALCAAQRRLSSRVPPSRVPPHSARPWRRLRATVPRRSRPAGWTPPLSRPASTPGPWVRLQSFDGAGGGAAAWWQARIPEAPGGQCRDCAVGEPETHRPRARRSQRVGQRWSWSVREPAARRRTIRRPDDRRQRARGRLLKRAREPRAPDTRAAAREGRPFR